MAASIRKLVRNIVSGQKILPSERNENDWPTGDYVNVCCQCKETFLGRKRLVVCRACEDKEMSSPPVTKPDADDAAAACPFCGGAEEIATLRDRADAKDIAAERAEAERDNARALAVKEGESKNKALADLADLLKLLKRCKGHVHDALYNHDHYQCPWCDEFVVVDGGRAMGHAAECPAMQMIADMTAVEAV